MIKNEVVLYLNWWTAFRSKKRWRTCDRRWRKIETTRNWWTWSGPLQCLRRPHEGSMPVWPKSLSKQPTKLMMISKLALRSLKLQKIICRGTWAFTANHKCWGWCWTYLELVFCIIGGQKLSRYFFMVMMLAKHGLLRFFFSFIFDLGNATINLHKTKRLVVLVRVVILFGMKI